MAGHIALVVRQETLQKFGGETSAKATTWRIKEMIGK
jgi:hypothetical protein